MKHIFLNLKRFDIPRTDGGVNSIAQVREWGGYIVASTQEALKRYREDDVEFVMYFPEAHLIPALNALSEDSPVLVGCQGVYREDTSVGGNFGAFTTNRTANAAKAMGCTSAMIGHCEERKDKAGVLAEAGVTDTQAVNRLLNMEIRQAVKSGLSVLYCIGESLEEQPRWKEVLKDQLEIGLDGVDTSGITIAYEPVWAIGPGRIPPDAAYIGEIASYIKEVANGLPVVYGGGLKTDNARMLASVSSIDGGLIALTRFQGDIGFYPDEYLEIIETYLGR
ncbi:triose-phosphate isomerase family protein [Lachnospiraceae bacterium 54-53]